jgi:hypothetical protein
LWRSDYRLCPKDLDLHGQMGIGIFTTLVLTVVPPG